MSTIDVSGIDATKPVEGVPAVKADLRDNLAAIKTQLGNAKADIEDLQSQINDIEVPEPGPPAEGGPTPFFTAENLGLTGNGADDDAFTLQQHIDAQHAVGSRPVYYLRPPGGNFRFNSVVRFRSGMRAVFTGHKILMGANGEIRTSGKLHETPLGADFNEPIPVVTTDTAAGETVIPLTVPTGWTTLPSIFPIGSRVVVRGMSDGSAVAIERHESTVVDVDSTTITILDELPFDALAEYPPGDYEANFGQPDKSRVSRATIAALAANAAEGAQTVTVEVADLVGFAVGDMVLITDDEVGGDTAGESTNLVNCEATRIVDIDGGTGVVTLSSALSNSVTTANGARLEKVLPCEGAVIYGANVEYIEDAAAAPARRVHPFTHIYSFNSTFEKCTVPEGVNFGPRGNGFLFFQSLSCKAIDCTVVRPKHLAAGDGNGFVINRSTDCHVINGYAEACRHSFLFQACNRSSMRGSSVDDRLAAVDLHGLNEKFNSCDISIVGGTLGTGVNTTRTAVKLGNTFHLKGSHKNSLRAKVFNWFGTNTRVVEIIPPSSDNYVEVEAINSTIGLYGRDIDQSGWSPEVDTLVARNNTVHLRASGLTGRIADVRGRANSSSFDAFDGLDVRLDCRDCQDSPLFLNTSNVSIGGRLTDKRAGGLSTYAMSLDSITGLRVLKMVVANAERGIRVVNCPGHVIADCLLGPVTAETDPNHLSEAGGNNGYQWINNTFIGPRTLALAGASTGTIRDLWTITGVAAEPSVVEAAPDTGGVYLLAESVRYMPEHVDLEALEAVDIQVPDDAPRGWLWHVNVRIGDPVTVSVEGGAGSVNGTGGGSVGAAGNGAELWIRVLRNDSGDAPIVGVKGDTTEARILAGNLDRNGKTISGAATISGTTTHTGDLAVAKVSVTEIVVTGALTVDGDHLSHLLRYTGAGHTWTINSAGAEGEVGVENKGSGAITVSAGTATVAGGSSIAAGKSATIRFSTGGADAKVLVEA